MSGNTLWFATSRKTRPSNRRMKACSDSHNLTQYSTSKSHRLQIEYGPTDHLEQLACCRLLLERLLQVFSVCLEAVEVVLLAIAPALFLETGADPRPQQHRVEWLRQIVLGSCLDAMDGTVHLRRSRDHDNRHHAQAYVRLHALQHFQSIDVWHHQVEQDEIEVGIGQRIQSGLTTDRHRNAIAVAGQPARQQISIGVIVVHDKNCS